MKSTRGEILTVALIVLGLLASSQAVPNFRLTHIFAKDKTAEISQQLSDSQAALQKAQDEAKKAADALAIAREAELQRKDDQARYSQQMVAGASKALESAPVSQPVALAQSLLSRASPALALAIGELPPDKQQAIFTIVAQSLSGAQKDLDAANAKLATLDKQLAVTSTERDSLKQQIPVLKTQMEEKDALVAQKTGEVDKKTTALVVQARQLQDKIYEAGSADAAAEKLGWLILILAGLYLTVHNFLPAIAREFPQYSILTKMANAVKNATTGHA